MCVCLYVFFPFFVFFFCMCPHQKFYSQKNIFHLENRTLTAPAKNSMWQLFFLIVAKHLTPNLHSFPRKQNTLSMLEGMFVSGAFCCRKQTRGGLTSEMQSQKINHVKQSKHLFRTISFLVNIHKYVYRYIFPARVNIEVDVAWSDHKLSFRFSFASISNTSATGAKYRTKKTITTPFQFRI